MSEPLRVAICDDHQLFRSGLSMLIERDAGLTVALEVGTLAQLHAQLAGARAQVLLLDVELPDGSGIDAVSRLAPSVNVVMLSAHAEPGTVRAALQSGAVGYVRKDGSADELMRMIRRAVSGATALSADVALSLADGLRLDAGARTFRERLGTLTRRQREVLDLLAEGRSNREIAKALFVSEGTVKNHVSQILAALDTKDRTRLALMVARHGVRP